MQPGMLKRCCLWKFPGQSVGWLNDSGRRRLWASVWSQLTSIHRLLQMSHQLNRFTRHHLCAHVSPVREASVCHVPLYPPVKSTFAPVAASQCKQGPYGALDTVWHQNFNYSLCVMWPTRHRVVIWWFHTMVSHTHTHHRQPELMGSHTQFSLLTISKTHMAAMCAPSEEKTHTHTHIHSAAMEKTEEPNPCLWWQ